MVNFSQLIVLHDEDWLERQRLAGKITGECLSFSKNLIEKETPNITLKDIERECLSIINKNDCIPTFKNYNGFPGNICLSINNQLVHGIPSSYKLKSGDIVKIDVGVTYKGAIGDAAITAIYGKPKDRKHLKLIDQCRQALYNGIRAIDIGTRLDVISRMIYQTAKHAGLQVITNYGGHGIEENKLHAPPFIENKSEYDSNIRIQPGMSFTLEPMVTIGNPKTKIGSNGWVVSTAQVNSHFEHTLFIHKDRVEILTHQNHEDIEKEIFFKQ